MDWARTAGKATTKTRTASAIKTTFETAIFLLLLFFSSSENARFLSLRRLSDQTSETTLQLAQESRAERETKLYHRKGEEKNKAEGSEKKEQNDTALRKKDGIICTGELLMPSVEEK